jgi:hypothetical protein
MNGLYPTHAPYPPRMRLLMTQMQTPTLARNPTPYEALWAMATAQQGRQSLTASAGGTNGGAPHAHTLQYPASPSASAATPAIPST